MNKENLLKVANLIEQHQERFNMAEWGFDFDPHLCETSACIAGFAATLGDRYAGCVSDRGTTVLGLNSDHASDLFMGEDDGIWVKYSDSLGLPTVESITYRGTIRSVDIADITPEMAITMLRNLASGEWTFPE